MMPDNADEREPQEQNPAKQPWEPMKLTYVGHVGEILHAGAGKFSHSRGDPGDSKKPRSSR
jgi:hypothetical protein